MTTKTADSKGRINLGSRYANRTVIIEPVDATEVRVILAEVLPQREVWLHKNPQAKASVLRGLAQAKEGKKTKSPPNLERDGNLVKELED
ncbi:MAG: hypothetical protein JXB10_18030 [Pirellulales bacterium]|nr:hypothetical protein [Pirellulales bacterium]